MVNALDIQKLTDQIVVNYHPLKIIIFGSFAEGNLSDESDIDLLVILKFDGKNALKAAEILNAIDPHFSVDLIVRTPDQIRNRLQLGDYFIKDIIEKGEVLYEAVDKKGSL